MNKIVVELTKSQISETMVKNNCSETKAIDLLLDEIGQNIYNYSYEVNYVIKEPAAKAYEENVDYKAWYC